MTEIPPIKLAFVIDNQVVDILHTDERLAAIFLSNPTIVDVSENFYNENGKQNVEINAQYDPSTNMFINPDPEILENPEG